MVGWTNWIWSIDDKSFILCICIYVDTLDYTKIPLRSVDEFGMESIDTAFIIEYGDNGSGEIAI